MSPIDTLVSRSRWPLSVHNLSSAVILLPTRGKRLSPIDTLARRTWSQLTPGAIVDNSVEFEALLDLADLSIEAALVLCCATTAATPARTALAADLAPRVRSWDRVVDIAKRHAVLPLVHRYLKLECPTAVPEEGLAKLRRQWQGCVATLAGVAGSLKRP